MTKKQADLNGDGKEEDALIAIDNQAFNTKVAYTNVNEPSAPTDVTLQTSGNEVMRAEWNESDNVDGYSVRIYEEKEKNRLFHNGGCASMQSDWEQCGCFDGSRSGIQ